MYRYGDLFVKVCIEAFTADIIKKLCTHFSKVSSSLPKSYRQNTK